MTLTILNRPEDEKKDISPVISKKNQDEHVREQIGNLLQATEQEIRHALTATQKKSPVSILLRAFLEKQVLIRGKIQKEIEEQSRKTSDIVNTYLGKIDVPPGTPKEMDIGHWQYRFCRPQRKERLFIDSDFGPYGSADRDKLRLFSDRVQVRKLDRIPGRLMGMHQKTLEIEREIESHDLRYILRGIANQFLGIEIAKLAKHISISGQDILRNIEKLNQETLGKHDLRIHVRNGIAIIGGTDEADPIFVIDSPETRGKFFSQDEDAAILFSENTATGTEPNIELNQELLRKISELQKQIETLEAELEKTKNQNLPATLPKQAAEHPIKHSAKPHAKPPVEPLAVRPEHPVPRPPGETPIEIKSDRYQLATTENLKNAAIKIAEFLADRNFPLNSIPGKPLQLHLEIMETNGKIIIKSNIRSFPSNCAIYKGRTTLILSEHLKVESISVQLVNF